MQNILFLPGMMCDERSFQPQVDFFHNHFQIQIAKPYVSKTMRAVAETILNQCPFESFYLCGLSMGGIVAMELLELAPHKIKGLILLDTNSSDDTDERKKMRDTQIQRAKDGALRNIIIEDMKPFYLADNREDKLKELFLDMAISLGANIFIAQSLALRNRKNYELVIRNCMLPTLIICGEKDTLCPPEKHETIKELMPNSRLCIVKDAGHIVNLEKSHEVNRIMQDWLNNQSKELNENTKK